MNKVNTHNKQKFDLQIAASTDNLQKVRDFIKGLAEKAGFNPEQIDQIQLAVDEACTNAIRHAYQYDSSKTIDLQVEIDNKKVKIVVTDFGPGFDPQSLPEPNINHSMKNAKPGGLGIHLMKKLMDVVRFKITPGKKTEVHLIKYKNASKKL